MSYQYNNIPSIEDSNQEGNGSGDNSMAYPNNARQPLPQGQPHQQQHQMHQHQQQHQMHQHQQQQPYGGARAYMPTYHEYMQSNVYGNGNGSSMSGFPSSFGSYGPNVGSTAWSRYIQDSKRNRIMVAVVIGIFLLLATSHSSPAPQSSPSSISSKNKKPTGGAAHKGIAGDGNQMHVNNNEPFIPMTSSTTSSEEKEHESAATDSATNRNSDTMDDTGPTTDDSPELNLAYLLTYPMSGTSYTMFLATRSTNRTVATNYYSDAQQSPKDEPIPVNEKAGGSPFWWGYSATYFETEKPKPDDYVLTLTHCGGWCLHPCPHYEYIESASLFEESCRYVFQTPGPVSEEVDITPKRDVKKIVHLIRDPFSNIVSRYHQYRMHSSKKSHSDKGSKDDFCKWCDDIDSNGEASPISSPSISLEIKEMMRNIPCHSEFFKYVAWHNHVVEMIWNEDYPTIQVYFEDYNNHGEDSSTEESADRKNSEEEEAMKIAKFLNISISETQARLPPFLKVKMYNSYFSEEEQKNVEMFVKTMAFRKTWTLLERYF